MNHLRNYFGFYQPIEVREVGIASDILNPIYAHQNKTQWCWTASISMVLRYHGFEVDQKYFARNVCGLDIFGNTGNCPAVPSEISRSLNISGNDTSGNAYSVVAPLKEGSPEIIELINQLENQKPVIIGYYNEDFRSSHAVVITGCRYEVHGNTIYLTHLFIRDPWVDIFNIMNRGRKVISNVADLLSRVHSYWYVDVYEYPGHRFVN